MAAQLAGALRPPAQLAGALRPPRIELFFKTPAELKERLRALTAAGYGSFNLVNKDKKDPMLAWVDALQRNASEWPRVALLMPGHSLRCTRPRRRLHQITFDRKRAPPGTRTRLEYLSSRAGFGVGRTGEAYLSHVLARYRSVDVHGMGLYSDGGDGAVGAGSGAAGACGVEGFFGVRFLAAA